MNNLFQIMTSLPQIVISPETDANDLHKIISGCKERYEIAALEKSFIDHKKKISGQRDPVLYHVAETAEDNVKKFAKWCEKFQPQIEKSEWFLFDREAAEVRSQFDTIRRVHNYLMWRFIRSLGVDEFEPRKNGVFETKFLDHLEYVLSKSATDEEPLIILYEDFDGKRKRVKVSWKAEGFDFDKKTGEISARPVAHWVGSNVYDSFYVAHFWSVTDEKWVAIPIELIISVIGGNAFGDVQSMFDMMEGDQNDLFFDDDEDEEEDFGDETP